MKETSPYYEQGPVVTGYGIKNMPDDDITRSLFDDKDAKISEENIQKILDGKYTLPKRLRVAVVNIENSSLIRKRYAWNDEDYLSSRQRYLTTMTSNLETQSRVDKVTLIPDIMMSSAPTFTSIREAAVRMQADIVLVYSIKGGIYSKYKMFAADEYKAFATTQVLIMDVRTGLVPFTTVVTEDYMSKKEKRDFNDSEAEKRTQEEAVQRALEKVCIGINSFLSK
jgi:hypothetical protein